MTMGRAPQEHSFSIAPRIIINTTVRLVITTIIIPIMILHTTEAVTLAATMVVLMLADMGVAIAAEGTISHFPGSV